MKYTILLYEAEGEIAKRSETPRNEHYWGAYRTYTEALQKAGVMVGGAALQPNSVATTVRLNNGKRSVQDGPYAEAKEQLGGFYIIDVPDLDNAIDWASRCPAAATGAVEVRPNHGM